ncbi:hypothetical protein V6N13_139443 [Hibiscus sabdariffa]
MSASQESTLLLLRTAVLPAGPGVEAGGSDVASRYKKTESFFLNSDGPQTTEIGATQGRGFDRNGVLVPKVASMPPTNVRDDGKQGK